MDGGGDANNGNGFIGTRTAGEVRRSRQCLVCPVATLCRFGLRFFPSVRLGCVGTVAYFGSTGPRRYKYEYVI